MSDKENIKGWCNSELCPPAQEIISRIKTETINEFMKKWCMELKDIRVNLIIKPTYIDKTFDVAIAVAERVAKEMTEGK